MSSEWTKDADWLNYTHVVSAIAETTKNLVSAEKSLMFLDIMKVPNNDPGRIQTEREIRYKEQYLSILKWKVKRAMKRITETDKTNFGPKYENALREAGLLESEHDIKNN